MTKPQEHVNASEVALLADLKEAERQRDEAREECTSLQLRLEQLQGQLTEADAALSIVREQLMESGKVDLSKIPTLASPKVHVQLEGYDRTGVGRLTGEKVIKLTAQQFDYSFTLDGAILESPRAASEFALAAEQAAKKLGEEVRRTVRDGLLQYGNQIISPADFTAPTQAATKKIPGDPVAVPARNRGRWYT